MSRKVVISIRDGSVTAVFGLDADDQVLVLDHDVMGDCDALVDDEEVLITEADVIEDDSLIDEAFQAFENMN